MRSAGGERREAQRVRRVGDTTRSGARQKSGAAALLLRCQREIASVSLDAGRPAVGFLLRLLPGHAVVLLQPPDELVALPGHHFEIVVRLAPPLLLGDAL